MGKARDKILLLDDIRKEVVRVPEWDCEIGIRGLTAAQRAKWGLIAKDAPDRTVPALVVFGTYDPETGQQLFDDSDIDVLAEKASGPIEQIANTILVFSKLNAGALETAEKN